MFDIIINAITSELATIETLEMVKMNTSCKLTIIETISENHLEVFILTVSIFCREVFIPTVCEVFIPVVSRIVSIITTFLLL